MAIPTEAAFAALYREQYSDVERFVARRVPPARVDDVVGETFLTAWRRRAELPPEPRPWLFRTARNMILNATRGDRRQEAVAVRVATTSVRDLRDPNDRVDTYLDVVGAWQSLGARDQEVLALHVWDGLSDSEAATVLGCSRAAYAMRLTRAKRRLADVLQPPAVFTAFQPSAAQEQS